MSDIELVEGSNRFIIGVPFACHGAKCDMVSEKAGEMLNRILGNGMLLIKKDPGDGREAFEEKLSEIKKDIPVIEIRSHNDQMMRGEDFIIQTDERRGRTVVHVNEKFFGDDEALFETMEWAAIELEV